jgi:hypothetical protein
MVDGVLPEARARVEITKVSSNFAWADEIERLPLEPDEEDDAGDADVAAEADDEDDERQYTDRERLGSRDNFWGG